MTVQPKAPTEPCNAKGTLIARLEAAHTEIGKLRSGQTEALIRGDLVSDAAFLVELGTAREERDHVALELRTHIAEHGC